MSQLTPGLGKLMGPEWFHVYGGHIVSRVATYLRDHLAVTRNSVGCTGTHTSPVYSFYGICETLFLFGHAISPGT